MTRLKSSVNSPHMKPWAEKIGLVVLNFSAIELESIQWMIQMQDAVGSVKKIANIPFAKRVNTLMDYVQHRSAGNRWKKASLRAWNAALQLAKVRNQIGHNPLIFGWHDPAEIGEPDSIGIPGIRGKKIRSGEVLLSPQTVSKTINELTAVALELEKLRHEWCSLRAQGKVPQLPLPKSRLARLIFRFNRYVVLVRAEAFRRSQQRNGKA